MMYFIPPCCESTCQTMIDFFLEGWILSWMVLKMMTSGLSIESYPTMAHAPMPLSRYFGNLGMSLGSPITKSPICRR